MLLLKNGNLRSRQLYHILSIMCFISELVSSRFVTRYLGQQCACKLWKGSVHKCDLQGVRNNCHVTEGPGRTDNKPMLIAWVIKHWHTLDIGFFILHFFAIRNTTAYHDTRLIFDFRHSDIPTAAKGQYHNLTLATSTSPSTSNLFKSVRLT